MSRRCRGGFDNGVAWDRVPEAPERPEGWFNPAVPPMSAEVVGEKFVDGAPSWLEARAGRVTASVSRYCAFYQARDGKWYMELAIREYGERDDATTYGPFYGLRTAKDYLHDNFSNPGGWTEDDSGRMPVPTRSPNGRPVHSPSSRPALGGTTRDEDMPGAFGGLAVVPQHDGEWSEARRTATARRVARATVMEELRYDMSVAEGKIAAYQDATAVLFYVERALGILKRNKAWIVARVGVSVHSRVVWAFEGYKREWLRIEEADSVVRKEREELERMFKSNEGLRSVLE